MYFPIRAAREKTTFYSSAVLLSKFQVKHLNIYYHNVQSYKNFFFGKRLWMRYIFKINKVNFLIGNREFSDLISYLTLILRETLHLDCIFSRN